MTDKIIVFSFTRIGTELNRKLCCALRKRENGLCFGYSPEKYAGGGVDPLPEDVKMFIGRNWIDSAFFFIGAAGIAVRYIAPWVKDKFTDPAVLVMDEKGQYVIPLLSGHVGGAVALADKVAEITGGTAVHTTATDVQGRFAPDVFAAGNHLFITDRKKAKEISAAILEGERIGFLAEDPQCRIEGNVPDELAVCRSLEEAEKFSHRILVSDQDPSGEEGTLLLRPKNVIAGIGCRKGISPEQLEMGLTEIMEQHGFVPDQLEAVASIDLKKEEPAILALAAKFQIPFITYSADELNQISEVTAGSDFVRKITGVDNVCERAALLYSQERNFEGELIQGKWSGSSMTAALVRRRVVLRFL